MSATHWTGVHFGTGVVIAVRQAAETTPDSIDINNLGYNQHHQHQLAQSLYTQYGIMSN